ncbi:MAG TPA: hypothetical protein VF665_14470, partial [Longimicrobium sp.]
LAYRLAVLEDRLIPEDGDFTSDVPLYESGREAADAGLKEIAEPTLAARRAIQKVSRTRAVKAGRGAR